MVSPVKTGMLSIFFDFLTFSITGPHLLHLLPPTVGGILVPCANRLYRPVLTFQMYYALQVWNPAIRVLFLIRFPKVLQNLPSTSYKIKLIRAILTMILPCQ